MTFKKILWEDSNPAPSAFHGFEILKRLGIPSDMIIESATIDLQAGSYIKLHTTFILSVKQIKDMGIDLNAES